MTPQKIHVFNNHCINFEDLLVKPDLAYMLSIAEKQAKTEDAKINVDFSNYKDYDNSKWCAAYFGMFVEWLAQHWLNHYGHIKKINIHGVEMVDSIGCSDEDYGIDGVGYTLKDKPEPDTRRFPKHMSPVYIQVKGTTNKTKIYQANDGSRIPNFCTNAMSAAIIGGHAYQARYVLFTTGKGVYYTLDKMSHNMLEIIGFNDISKCMDKDFVFLNILREAAGLQALAIPPAEPDAESIKIKRELGID